MLMCCMGNRTIPDYFPKAFSESDWEVTEDEWQKFEMHRQMIKERRKEGASQKTEKSFITQSRY